MGRAKDLWIAEHERALEAYVDDGDRQKAETALSALGFDAADIAEELDAIDEQERDR